MEILIIFLLIISIILLVILLAKKNKLDDGEIRRTLSDELERNRRESSAEIGSVKTMLLTQGQENIRERAETQKLISDSLTDMLTRNQRQSENINETLTTSVNTLRTENEKKLEEIRKTVDEKLNNTLTTRLDGSFKQVTEQLTSLYKALGEMKELSGGISTNVTSLHRIFSNVKSRGTFAEVQLKNILNEVIPGRFEENYRSTKGEGQVEFAIKLPAENGEITYLPLDSKFPMEDYIRLNTAIDEGDTAQIDIARTALLKNVENSAKLITKYINVPETTPFAIMYLATEGLYNEVLTAKTGVAEKIQREYNIMIAGPTTIVALLSSLTLGFRNIAINEKAAEIKKILEKVIKDYGKFENNLNNMDRYLRSVMKEVEDAKKRTDIIQRTLNKIEETDDTDDN